MKIYLAFALATSVAAPALACEDVSCSGPIVLPGGNREIPSNALLFEVVHELQDVKLVDASSGAVIPSSVKTLGPDRVWSPDVPVAEGTTLALSYRTTCIENTVELWVAAPAAKDRASSLRAQDDPDRVASLLTYEPPTFSPNFLRLDVEVDGRPFRATFYMGPYAGTSEQFELAASCDQPPPNYECEVGTQLSAERHEIVFRARKLGEQAVDVQKATLDLRCGVAREPAQIGRDEEEGCQLGASGGGAAMWLALLLRRRRQGTSSASAASTSARV